MRQTLAFNHRNQEFDPGGARTCLACRRLHSLQSPCPHRMNLYVTAVRQWEAGLLLDEALAPHIREKAGEIAARCDSFIPDLI